MTPTTPMGLADNTWEALTWITRSGTDAPEILELLPGGLPGYHQWKVLKAGIYDIRFHLRIDGTGTTGLRQARIVVFNEAGTVSRNWTMRTPALNAAHLHVSALVRLAAGDTIQFEGFQSSGSSQTIGIASTSAQVMRVAG